MGTGDGASLPDALTPQVPQQSLEPQQLLCVPHPPFLIRAPAFSTALQPAQWTVAIFLGPAASLCVPC